MRMIFVDSLNRRCQLVHEEARSAAFRAAFEHIERRYGSTPWYAEWVSLQRAAANADERFEAQESGVSDRGGPEHMDRC